MLNYILDLLDKARLAQKADDALKFSQAAANSANALRTFYDSEYIRLGINRKEER